MNNPFSEGDTVWWDDEMYEVLEIDGERCFVSDIGAQISNLILAWVDWRELEQVEDDDYEEGQWLG